MSTRDSDASDSLSELDTDPPVPSRSYAPHSLKPFRPLQVPELSDEPIRPSPANPDRTAWIIGAFGALGLVAFVMGALYVVSGG